MQILSNHFKSLHVISRHNYRVRN